jgi:hypothetical protein
MVPSFDHIVQLWVQRSLLEQIVAQEWHQTCCDDLNTLLCNSGNWGHFWNIFEQQLSQITEQQWPEDIVGIQFCSTMTFDDVSTTMICVRWCEEHHWNCSILHWVHLSDHVRTAFDLASCSALVFSHHQSLLVISIKFPFLPVLQMLHDRIYEILLIYCYAKW